MNEINSVNFKGFQELTPLNTTGLQEKPMGSEKPFGEFLKGAIEEVNQLEVEADQSIDSLTKGESKDIHQTMIAMQKADISLQLLMKVRDKAVDAYKQLMQMGI
jgi:flagellar hook-basal body complex protein FliE